MIISHKNKYLYIEFPRTGCTAIANELVKYYDGERILHKHATYYEFLKIAEPEEREYFTFSNIRNPLDKAVSAYRKMSSYWLDKDLSSYNFIVKQLLKKKIDFVNSGGDFQSYLLKFYKLPYDDWSILNHKQFDFIIKTENIEEDFKKVLRILGLEYINKLPVVNKTLNKSNYYELFNTLKIQEAAIRIFGIYMKKWDYDFPFNWNHKNPRMKDKILLFFTNIARIFYYKYLYNKHLR